MVSQRREQLMAAEAKNQSSKAEDQTGQNQSLAMGTLGKEPATNPTQGSQHPQEPVSLRPDPAGAASVSLGGQVLAEPPLCPWVSPALVGGRSTSCSRGASRGWARQARSLLHDQRYSHSRAGLHPCSCLALTRHVDRVLCLTGLPLLWTGGGRRVENVPECFPSYLGGRE